MRGHLDEFIRNVQKATTSKKDELIVRHVVEEVAKDCPIGILVQIGQCIIDCRKSELHDEAERN